MSSDPFVYHIAHTGKKKAWEIFNGLKEGSALEKTEQKLYYRNSVFPFLKNAVSINSSFLTIKDRYLFVDSGETPCKPRRGLDSICF